MSIFYEIIATNGKKSYLFGTFHSSRDKKIVTLPFEVKKAFDSCSCFISESDGSECDTMDITRLFLEWGNVQIQHRYLPKSLPEHYIRNLAEQLSGTCFAFFPESNKLFSIPPVFITSRMAGQEESTNISKDKNLYFLDQQLQDASKLLNKPMFFLESPKEALIAGYGLDLNYQDHLAIYDYYISQPQPSTETVNLERMYLDEDIEGARNLETIYLKDAPDVVKRYNVEIMIDNRDDIWSSRMYPYLQDGNAFIAVGNLHLKGIIKRLTEKGLEIRPISLSTRLYPITGSSIVGSIDSLRRSSRDYFFNTPIQLDNLTRRAAHYEHTSRVERSNLHENTNGCLIS